MCLLLWLCVYVCEHVFLFVCGPTLEGHFGWSTQTLSLYFGGELNFRVRLSFKGKVCIEVRLMLGLGIL